LAIRFADTGAVMNRKSVISSSWMPNPPDAQLAHMLASSTPPTPSVVALVGACSRMKKSPKRTIPAAPTTVKNAPMTSSTEITASATGWMFSIMSISLPLPYSITSPRVR
jgi:hypothetical protein